MTERTGLVAERPPDADAPPPAIDMCALPYDRDGWRAYFRHLAAEAPGYLRAFGKRVTAHFRADPAEYRRRLDAGDVDGAIEVLVERQPDRVDPVAHLRAARAEGMVFQVALGADYRLPDGQNINQRLVALASAAPDRIQAWAGLDLRSPRDAVAEMERMHAQGARGLAVTPFLDGVDPTDPSCDPVFGAAAELGMPVWIHTGQHFCVSRPAELSHPRNLDLIATRHPRLVLIAGHAGWPWVLETIAVAQRHRNVYIEFSTHRPAWMGRAGSGWEPLLLYGRGAIRRKVMFGTATWVHDVSPSVLAREVAGIGLDEGVVRDWLYGNAARLLGLSS